jgi:hypothetical protein
MLLPTLDGRFEFKSAAKVDSDLFPDLLRPEVGYSWRYEL